MRKCFSEIVLDDDGLEKRIGEVIESIQKESEAAKDRVIQTFNAKDEKLREEGESRSWRSSRRL